MAANKCEYKPIRKRRVISLKSLHFGPRNECRVQFWGHLLTRSPRGGTSRMGIGLETVSYEKMKILGQEKQSGSEGHGGSL